MATDDTGLHEPANKLTAKTVERHRAIASLVEELEAVDWYAQRIDACSDEELARILAHNRDEEKEHACMILEWLRRHDESWEALLRRYLFSEGRIDAEPEERARVTTADGDACDGSLAIGRLAQGAPR